MRHPLALLALLSACAGKASSSPSTGDSGAITGDSGETTGATGFGTAFVPTAGTVYLGPGLYSAFSVGDADGDGRPEIIVSIAQGVDCFQSVPQPGVFVLGAPFDGGRVQDVAVASLESCTSTPDYAVSWDQAFVALPGDLTGDGLPDALVGLHDRMDVFAGPLLGDLPRTAAVATLEGMERGWTGDLDGDGIPEVMGRAGIAYGPLSGPLGVADLRVRFASEDPSIEGEPSEPVDLDHDGRLNVIWSTPTGWLTGGGARLLLDEDLPEGDLSPFAVDIASWTPSQVQMASGDVTGDGLVDLVIGDQRTTSEDQALLDGRAYVIDGPQGGELAQSFATFEGSYPTDHPLSAAVGDLDGDGLGDLALGWTGGRVAVHLGPVLAGPHPMTEARVVLTGAEPPVEVDGGFYGPALSSVDRFGSSLKMADLDGDEVDELIVGVPGQDAYSSALHILWSGSIPGLP